MSAPAILSLDPFGEYMTEANHRIAVLITRYHRDGRTFTADDVHDVTGDPDDSSWPGTVFRAARARGEIVKTHAYVPSRRKGRKGSIIAVWRPAT